MSADELKRYDANLRGCICCEGYVVMAPTEYGIGEYVTHKDAAATIQRLEAELAEAKSPVRTTNAMQHGCAFEGWQCFHCGEIFTTVGGARDHFGFDQNGNPACRIKLGGERGLVMALRKAEEDAATAWSRLHMEGGEAMLAYQSAISRFGDALRQAEETGYSKGLKDYTKLEEEIAPLRALFPHGPLHEQVAAVLGDNERLRNLWPEIEPALNHIYEYGKLDYRGCFKERVEELQRKFKTALQSGANSGESHG